MFSVVRDYLSNSSFHGLHFLVDPGLHWTERLFWLLSVLACWAGCAYLMISWMQFAYLNPVSLSVDTSYLHWKIPGAGIVVCEINSPSLLKIKDTRTREKIQDRVFFKYHLSGTPLFHINNNKMWNWGRYRSNCSDLFNYCGSYDGKEFDCCKFFIPFETNMGNCFAANTIQNTNLDWDSVFVTRESTNLVLEFKNPCIKLYAISNDEIVTESNRAIITQSNLDAYAEYEVHLSVSQTTSEPSIREIDIERRKCRFSDENYLQVSRNYSFAACKLQCQKDAHLKLMNCTTHYMPFTDHNQICTENQLHELIQMSEIWRLKAEENCPCELSCISSDILFIGKTFVTERTNKTKKNDSMCYVYIDITPSTVKTVRKMAHSMLDNIVNVGGTAGLFVGASLLSIVEVFYFFTVRALDTTLMKRIQRSRKVKPRARVIVSEPIFIEVYPFVN